jgi:hypothetical protein
MAKLKKNAMKSKTLYCCPKNPEQVLFEEVFDDGVAIVYLQVDEPPQICPKCESLFYKHECLVIEELLPGSETFAETPFRPSKASAH